MYSILIQNQKTMESFHQFYPIFIDAIQKGDIDVCQWMEEGTTIETAIPELYNLIECKEEWRAVIVRIEDEADKLFYPTLYENPYDFLENTDTGYKKMEESGIPLIRLTQMLGGIPAPSVEFECRQIPEKNGKTQAVYLPQTDEESQKNYEALCEKYHFYGKRPTEILLVSLRYRQDARLTKIQKAWENRKEDESSAFWRRNAYPSICRFLFYEMERQGNDQRTADLFRVWLSVRLLTANKIPPDVIKAYRLYRLNVRLDRASMRDSIQKSVNRAVQAKNYVKKSIQREMESDINTPPELPDYKIRVPVVLPIPDRSRFSVREQEFCAVPDSASSDLSRWEDLREKAEEGIRSVKYKTARTLNQTAERIRGYCGYTWDEVLPLDTYQRQDMDRELVQLRVRIFHERGRLREHLRDDDPERENGAEKVRERILRRMTKHQAVLGYVGMAAAFLIPLLMPLLIPSVAHALTQETGAFRLILCTAATGMMIFGIAAVIQLQLQKLFLYRDIRYYNHLIQDVVTGFTKDTEVFSGYMSAVASYIHGNSYLNALEAKGIRTSEGQSHKKDCLMELNAFLTDLRWWADAFHLRVEFERTDMGEEIAADMESFHIGHHLYTFADKDTHDAFLNHTDDTVESPFTFVERLLIMREELYDDAR